MGKKSPGTCVILYYHTVTSEQRKRFAQQMDNLTRWVKPIAICVKEGLERDTHHVAVTFDDGFQCVIENALPELIQRKIPSTLFVPTGYFGQPATWDGISTHSDHRETVMTVDQLQKLPSDLISIGSHTITHSSLPRLTEEEIRRELYESRQKLESITGRDIKLLSFPYGEYNETVIKWARQTGYEHVFTTIPKLVYSVPEDYVIGRISVEPTDWSLEFRLKLLGAYRWLPFAFALKRKLRSTVRKYFVPIYLSLNSIQPGEYFVNVAKEYYDRL
jgi:peptidoglycan/xylan/chitin deacetylase (PgdA/CDA1 family)